MPEPTAPSSRGAIDLAAFKTPHPEPVNGTADAGAPTWVRSVNQELFPEIVALSQQVPVIVSLGSPRSPASVQLDATLASLVDAKGGTLALATVDAEAEAAIAQAFQVTQVPAVIALVNGQPVPLFQGSADVQQIQSLIEELLGLGVQHGVAGTIAPLGTTAAATAPAPLPPLHQAALDAIESGDLPAAENAYKQALNEKPNDNDAAIGLNQVRLLMRTQDKDLAAVRAAGAANPDDLAAQLDVADMDLIGGHVEDAFSRLVGFIGRHAGDEKEAARARLVELYSVVGVADERVVASRQKLARVLF
ncbi:co-chaperone YbbN [Paeniglutamicibacter psychrophenolicus]|uniref:co-chaperone YbbN n=1 Tax=Paeniglutamicibacter psychrophenolicus TaxID=257454 RepID=UPI0027841518|nr:tetratricopeptide repeat protein [Paeniglutamicibacter psychrophenolicus]MDQ0095842.1 putative thioredoxin [Paeniglutamicibacter psychrophenolicus]